MFDLLPAFRRIARDVANDLFSGELTVADCTHIALHSFPGYHAEARILRVNGGEYARVRLIETASDDMLACHEFRNPRG